MKQDFNKIKKTGFKTPDNYFNTIEDDIMNAIHQKHNLNSIKESGFKTPKNYFDTLDDDIINKIEEKNIPKVIKLFSKQNLVYISGVAAAIIIMFGIFMNTNNSPDLELDYDLVESYIINQDISTYELASLLTDEELNNINLEIMDEAFNNDDMENYLLENVNLEDIIEQ